MYQLMSRELENSKYAPGYLSDARPRILDAIKILELVGFQDYAADLKTQLESITVITDASAPKAEPVKSAMYAGTAFVVRPDGWLLTAFHVVQNAHQIVVVCPGKEPIPVQVEASSSATDLAVLKAPGFVTPDYLSLADPRGTGIGAKVFTVGYPAPDLLGADAKFTEGVISSVSGPGGDAIFLQTTVPTQSGSSGGPLVNEQGEVVGILTLSASASTFLQATGSLPQNVNWAVKSVYASAIFDGPARLAPSTDRSAAIQRTVRATCRVIGEGNAPSN